MSSAIVPANPAPQKKPSSRSQPLLAFFASERLLAQELASINRYRRIALEDALDQDSDLECIVVTADEQLVAAHYNDLRKPNVRVIALAANRYKDARTDGMIYAYLPPETPVTLIERMVDNALDHIHTMLMRRDINDRLLSMAREIHELNEIGAALSAEHDTEKLLEMILTKARQITNSDAGSLYVVEQIEPQRELPRAGGPVNKGVGSVPSAPHKRLRFKLAQNDSVNISFKEAAMEISDRSIAGYVALTGSVVNLEDAYRLPPEVPYSINRKFDEDSGYRTKSILVVPMRTPQDEIVGVLQLINAKKSAQARLNTLSQIVQQVCSYGDRQQDIVLSLASQAAVALENSRLYEAIQRLFEGFVRASVTAIESRDPATSGHSFRVANLTVALAELVDRSDLERFAQIRFTRTEMREIRYASLLHDFGKVGVREEVLVKAKKLYPAQLELIQQRFHFVKRTMQQRSLESRLDYVLKQGREKYLQKLDKFDKELAAQLEELGQQLQVILRSNEPTVLAEGSFDRLLEIAAQKYEDLGGEKKDLLTQDEVRLLSIRRGSLDDSERLQIESHVLHTVNFLQQIPWTKEIKNIPAIAMGHHEKLNGQGYPYKLSAPEIPVQTRMMTISDIFDAISAVDRPYKKAVGLERALQILEFAVKDGEIDPDLFQLFREGKIYERWKVEPYPY